MYDKYWVNKSTLEQGPRAKQFTGANTYTTTHRNKTVNVDKIKHTFIVLVLPTIQCLNIKKTCCTQHT